MLKYFFLNSKYVLHPNTWNNQYKLSLLYEIVPYDISSIIAQMTWHWQGLVHHVSQKRSKFDFIKNVLRKDICLYFTKEAGNNPEEISVRWSDAALCNIWQKSALFFQNWFYFNVFLGDTSSKLPFFLRFQTLPLNSRLHSEKVLQYNDKSLVLTSTIFVRLQPPNVKWFFAETQSI